MSSMIQRILNMYDQNHDFRLTIADFPSNDNQRLRNMQQSVENLPIQEKNYIYSFIYDQSLRQRLNINNSSGLYRSNDLLREEIMAKWPNSGQKIINTAEVFSLNPVIIVSLLAAERKINNQLNDHTLTQEDITSRAKELKDKFLNKHNGNLLWALAEYHLARYTRINPQIINDWKMSCNYYYSDNIRLLLKDDLGVSDANLPENHRKAGIAALAYIREDTETYNFVQEFIHAVRDYQLSPDLQDFFPDWIKDNFVSNSLKNILTILNPFNWAGFVNLNLAPDNIQTLNGVYFELYKKLAYLGLADSSIRNFTNENLINVLKYSGYLNLSLLDIGRLRDYHNSGNIQTIFPEENARLLLAEIDQTIEKIHNTRNLIRNISFINRSLLRERLEKDFCVWLQAESLNYGRPINEMITINFKGSPINWKMPANTFNNSYFAFVLAINEQYQPQAKYSDFEVIINPEFNEFLNKRYNLSIDNYSLPAQVEFIRKFCEDRAKNSTYTRKISFEQIVDNLHKTPDNYDYRRLFNFINDFLANSSNYGLPFYSSISSGYGFRKDPLTDEPSIHYGLDIAGFTGQNIKSISGGIVSHAGFLGNFGRCVIVRISPTEELIYAHCDTIKVNLGDRVKIGDEIATIGRTGRVSGSHLHIEYRRNGVSYPLNNAEKSIEQAMADYYNQNWQKYSMR